MIYVLIHKNNNGPLRIIIALQFSVVPPPVDNSGGKAPATASVKTTMAQEKLHGTRSSIVRSAGFDLEFDFVLWIFSWDKNWMSAGEFFQISYSTKLRRERQQQR